ncbi:MAG: response regulator [Bacteroidia bacterium]
MAKKKLFLIEDDPAWVEALRAHLPARFEVEVFSSAEEAIENLSQAPTFLIVDYHLRGEKPGIEVVRSAQKLPHPPYAIMLSGQEDLQVAVDCFHAGVYDYIIKGDTAIQRLKILFRNIEKQEKLAAEVLELRLRFKKWKLFVAGILLLILVGSSIIYFRTCPSTRLITWDPFKLVEKGECLR